MENRVYADGKETITMTVDELDTIKAEYFERGCREARKYEQKYKALVNLIRSVLKISE